MSDDTEERVGNEMVDIFRGEETHRVFLTSLQVWVESGWLPVDPSVPLPTLYDAFDNPIEPPQPQEAEKPKAASKEPEKKASDETAQTESDQQDQAADPEEN